MSRPVWRDCKSVDDHHELEITPGTFLAIHRMEPDEPWQAVLLTATGNEDFPVALFELRAKKLEAAKREVLRRAAKELQRMLQSIESVLAA